MCDAPIGTTSWSLAVERNGFEEDDIFGGHRHNGTQYKSAVWNYFIFEVQQQGKNVLFTDPVKLNFGN